MGLRQRPIGGVRPGDHGFVIHIHRVPTERLAIGPPRRPEHQVVDGGVPVRDKTVLCRKLISTQEGEDPDV